MSPNSNDFLKSIDKNHNNLTCNVSKLYDHFIETLYYHRDRSKDILREETCTLKAFHALDNLTWVKHQLKGKS